MAKTRSELREKCMIILYQWDIYKDSEINPSIDNIIKDNMEIENDFVKDIVYGVVTHQNEIDETANKYMIDWNVDRIDKTGKAILRIAIFELLYTDIPPVVAINEAINLAKKYSDDNVRKIINAILDKLVKE